MIRVTSLETLLAHLLLQVVFQERYHSNGGGHAMSKPITPTIHIIAMFLVICALFGAAAFFVREGRREVPPVDQAKPTPVEVERNDNLNRPRDEKPSTSVIDKP